jgi:hypothetical protein
MSSRSARLRGVRAIVPRAAGSSELFEQFTTTHRCKSEPGADGGAGASKCRRLEQGGEVDEDSKENI